MASTGSALRAPLNEALGDEIRSLDVQLARAWLLLGLTGIVGGLAVHLFLSFVEGLAVAALSAIGSTWFAVQIAWLQRGGGRRAILVGTIVEAITPPAFLLAIAATRGPAHALGSYVPPMLFAAVIAAGVARLRSWTAIVFGAVNGVLFLVVYFTRLQPALSAREAAEPLLSPGMQLIRAVSFAAGGLLAYMVTQALKRAIGRAERNVRSHDLFGKYRLGGKLGAGGMGAVHSAVYCPEGGFERTVAVKLLHEHLADQPRFIQAFREEAELSARLAHPNIVQVLDFGRFGDAYFLAMEYVEGTTLATLAKRSDRAKKALSPDLVAWIGQQILAGLAHSHAGARDAEGKLLHIVHRDLCPSNVLVSGSGEVKISDFGVAKALRDATVSETKTVAGHSGYMSPEQVRAEPIDETCDLFAVGVILWELLAGTPLFRRGSDGLTMMALLNHEVSAISTKRSDVDPAWDRFFDKALAPRPTDRFLSASDMAAALGELHDPSRSRLEELSSLVAWARNEEAEEPDLGATVQETRSTELHTPHASPLPH